MKVGILNAIPLESSKVNWQGSPIAAYIRFLESAGVPLTYAGYDVAQGEFPATIDECDAYVISGSPLGGYDTDPWIADLIYFVRASYTAGKQLVGICFGHQLLAQALGGRVEKSSRGWGLGLKSFTVTAQKSWMTGEPGAYTLYFAHQDQVEELPASAERLAGSGFCPTAMFVIEDQVLGIQGHPEFSESIMQDILTAAKGKIPAPVVSVAADSLRAGVPDNQIFAQWIVNFINLPVAMAEPASGRSFKI